MTPLPEIQRYSLRVTDQDGYEIKCWTIDGTREPHGDWVRWSDVESKFALLDFALRQAAESRKELEERLKAAEAVCESLQEDAPCIYGVDERALDQWRALVKAKGSDHA